MQSTLDAKDRSDQGGVDLAVLHQLRSLNTGEPDFFERMILLLLEELNKWQPILSHASEHRDWVQLVKAAHETGGTGMQCGAGKLAELWGKLQLMDAGDFIRARMVLPELLAEIELVRRILTGEVTHSRKLMSVTALIVDDSPAARKLIGHHLRQIGCELVGEAETAAEGLRLFNQLRPDLITLVLMMPNTHGVDSTALVDAVKRTAPEVGIIVVSSIPFEKLRSDFLEKGVLDYVIKPFNDYTIQRLRVKLMRAFPQLLTID